MGWFAYERHTRESFTVSRNWLTQGGAAPPESASPKCQHQNKKTCFAQGPTGLSAALVVDAGSLPAKGTQLLTVCRASASRESQAVWVGVPGRMALPVPQMTQACDLPRVVQSCASFRPPREQSQSSFKCTPPLSGRRGTTVQWGGWTRSLSSTLFGEADRETVRKHLFSIGRADSYIND